MRLWATRTKAKGRRVIPTCRRAEALARRSRSACDGTVSGNRLCRRDAWGSLSDTPSARCYCNMRGRGKENCIETRWVAITMNRVVESPGRAGLRRSQPTLAVGRHSDAPRFGTAPFAEAPRVRCGGLRCSESTGRHVGREWQTEVRLALFRVIDLRTVAGTRPSLTGCTHNLCDNTQ